jgi:hypothetical protein
MKRTIMNFALLHAGISFASFLQCRSLLKIKSLLKEQELPRQGAESQRYRKEKPHGRSLCVFFASLRLCVMLLIRFQLVRVMLCSVTWLITPNAVALAQTAILKDAVTPIAAEPSPKSRVIAVLAAGDTVRILKTSGAWARVAFRGKKIGWMFVGSSGALTSKPSTEGKVESKKREESTATSLTASTPRPLTDGGFSFHLGAFGGQFTYVGKFFYKSTPAIYVEGTFQYVAGEIASFYLMHGNAKYVRPLRPRLDGTLTVGVGIINTVPIRSAGNKSVSNMAFNYGLGVQRHLKNNNWLRLDLRQYAVLRQQGLTTFLEIAAGVAIGINWSKL